MHWQIVAPASAAAASLFGRPRARTATVDEVWDAFRKRVATPYDASEILLLALESMAELLPAEGYYAYVGPPDGGPLRLRLTRTETGTPQIGINYAGLVAGAPIRQAPLELPPLQGDLRCEEDGAPGDPYLSLGLGARIVLRAALRRRQHAADWELKSLLALGARLQPVLQLLLALEDGAEAIQVTAVESATRQLGTEFTLQTDKLLALVSRLGGEALRADAGYCAIWQAGEAVTVWQLGEGEALRRAFDPASLPAVPAGLWLAPRLPSGVADLGLQGFALISVRDGSSGGAVAYGLRRPPQAEAAVTDVLATLSDSLRRSLGSRLHVLGLGDNYLQSLLAVARLLDATENGGTEHSERVAELAEEIGRSMGRSESDLAALRLAGLLHDIGMVAVDLGLPMTGGAISEPMRRVIQQHPIVGATLLAGLPGQVVPPGVVTAVRHHHERWDGNGYPDRLAGPAIDPLARILACAEVFVARTSPRSYRAGLSPARALYEVQRLAGHQIDPEVVDALVAACARRGTAPQPPEA